jgi:hypothetical protein
LKLNVSQIDNVTVLGSNPFQARAWRPTSCSFWSARRLSSRGMNQALPDVIADEDAGLRLYVRGW